MDLTIPDTLYPGHSHWIAWLLFTLAMIGAVYAALVAGRARGWIAALIAGVMGGIGFLFLTVIAGFLITFFRQIF